MHDLDRTQLETPEMEAFEAEGYESESYGEASLNEVEEMELAAELLEVTDEAELDQFLGNLFKKIKKGAGGLLKPLGGVLKGIAKKALPLAGGALGSLIPIPGVGTALGTALGSAASNVLEAELEGLNEEDREFEKARRFVRLAHGAARRVAKTPPNVNPRAAILKAIKAALREQQSKISNDAGGGADGSGGSGMGGSSGHEGSEEFEFEDGMGDRAASSGSSRRSSGRWVRRGGKIVLLGV